MFQLSSIPLAFKTIKITLMSRIHRTTPGCKYSSIIFLQLLCQWQVMVSQIMAKGLFNSLSSLTKMEHLNPTLHRPFVVGIHWSSDQRNPHDDVIKWKKFPRYWPFVWGIHRAPVNSPHKGRWCGDLIFSFCAWINDWVTSREAGDLSRHRTNYYVTLMKCPQYGKHDVTCIWFQLSFSSYQHGPIHILYFYHRWLTANKCDSLTQYHTCHTRI